MRQVFSCEYDDQKRRWLLMQGGMQHMFKDVADFDKGRGYWYVCCVDHAIDQETCGIDLLQAGPSCRDLSRCNNSRKSHAGCYADEDERNGSGTSATTYKFGFRKASVFLVF